MDGYQAGLIRREFFRMLQQLKKILLSTPANEIAPRFSPDGRWIAYTSNEHGNSEIYVRPFPGGSGGEWQISSSGGLVALWSKNRRELFYETADNRIMVLDY